LNVQTRRAEVLAALLALALVSACGEKSEAEHLQTAKEQLRQGQAQGAVVELKSVLQKHPGSAEGRFLLGNALLDQGEFVSAQTELGKALEAGYDEQLVAPKMARAKVMAGKFKEVIGTYHEMNLQDPKGHAELHTALAAAYAVIGQTSKGEIELEDALRADPANAWALLTKARFLAAKGDFDGALGLIDKIIKTGGDRQGEAYVQRGAILRFGKQDLDGAIVAYTKAVDDPQVGFQARLSLLNTYLLKSNSAAAQEQLQALKKSYGSRPQTRLAEAQMAYLNRDYNKAKEVVDGLLRNAPENKMLLAASGAIDMHRGALLAAETKLTKAIQTSDPMPFARKMLAETYVKMGQSDRALTALRPMLESNKPDRDTLVLAGQAQLMAGNLAEAESLFGGARKLAPNDSSVLTALALTELAKGNAELAFTTLQNVAEKDEGEIADLALISAHMRRNEFDLALKAIANLERKQPKKPGPVFLRGMALRGKGDTAGARSAFQATLQIEPAFFDATAQLVAIDVSEHRFDDAQARLEAVVKQNPRNVVARSRMLDLLVLRRARPEQVDAAVQDAIKANPQEPQPHLFLINRLLNAGNNAGALAAAQEAQLRLPDNTSVLEALGRAQQAAGERQQAINSFQKLANMMPRSPRPYLAIAGIQAAAFDQSSAARSVRKAYEVAPQSADVHRYLLAAADQSKDVTLVMWAAKDLQTRFPASAAGYALEGEGEAIRKNWAAAARIHAVALTKADANMSHRLRQYDILAASGHKDEAEQFVAQWLRRNPKDHEFLSRLGELALARKDYGTAERRFNAVAAIQPSDASAYNNLAWITVQKGGKGSVALAEKALALMPKSPTVLDTLAAAQAAEGRLDQAIATQQQAIAVALDPTQLRLNLVALLIKAGQKDKARTELVALEANGGVLAQNEGVKKLKQALDAR
jgi:putative PEP-CTERM system TPR-repeat lipoprotein